MTKVLVSGGLADGGVSTHVRLLAECLRHWGAQVTVAATGCNWPQDAMTALRGTGARVVTTPWGFGKGSVLGRAQALLTWPILLRREFDTLYCIGHGRMHHFLRRFVRPGGRCFYHEVVDAPPQGHPIIGLASRMDGVISCSLTVARRWANLLPDAMPMRAIPFLTNAGERRSQEREWRTGREQLRLAYLGRLVSHKRPDWLVESWREIRRRIGDARLDIYGGDYENEPMLEPLRVRVRQLDLQAQVAVRGPYGSTELGSILAGTDAVLLPSRSEGMPLVLVEAMSAGVPFVATDAGGTRDLENPNVVVTAQEDDHFLAGLEELARKIRGGGIDHGGLMQWSWQHFSNSQVAGLWRVALTDPVKGWQVAQEKQDRTTWGSVVSAERFRRA